MTGFIFGIFKFILVLLSPFFISGLIHYIYFYLKGYRMPKGSVRAVGYGNFFKKLFWDFPRRFVLDKFTRNPDEFKEYGVHVIAGEQGSGKSITLTYMLRRFQKMYPNMVVKTNYGYAFEDDIIVDWRDILNSNNGEYGEIDVLDEIQNWFNSMQSKDFPPDMLAEITQQRKQRKCIFGTSQVFGRVAKPIREQVMFLYEPITIFGCLTIVRKYKPQVTADGQTAKKNLRQVFFFVHDDDLRNSFDTYKKIERLGKIGFKPTNEQISTHSWQNNNNNTN